MRRQFCAGLFALGALVGSAHAQVTVELLDNAYGTSISADGSVVAGNLNGNYETFRWTQQTGVVPLGMSTVDVFGTGAGGPDISADGTRISATILGADSTYTTQGRWTLGVGWEEMMPPLPATGNPLDHQLGSAWGMSDDGETVCGLYWRAGQPDGTAHASSWTSATGAVGLGSDGRDSRGNECDADGNVIVGWAASPGFGNWQATVWVDGVMTVLEDTGGFCSASTVTADGTTVFGETYDDRIFQFSGAAWDWDGAAWNKRDLGFLPGTAPDQGHVQPNDCTPNGDLVVGFNAFFFGNSTGFLWTEETGIVDIVDFLAERGVTLPFTFDPQSVTAVSDDGSVLLLIGQSMQFPFQGQTYIIRLDSGVDAPEIAAAGGVDPVRAWPNPTRGATSFSFDLPRAGHAELSVYDASGRLVRRLQSGELGAGPHAAAWDGRDQSGAKVAAGVYFYRFEAGATRTSRKLVMVR